MLRLSDLPANLDLAQVPRGTTPRRLRECPDCGQRQVVPALRPGTAARCLRCNRLLRRARHDSLDHALALNVAALALVGVACLMPLMKVSAGGMDLSATLFSGPEGLRSDGLWELSVVVLFTSVAAPIIKLLAMTYVLAGLQLRQPWPHLRQTFGWIERLRPWSMVEVYLLGVFVAYTKLIDLVHIDLGPGIYALGALMVTMIAADAVLDHQAVWEALESPDSAPEAEPHEASGAMDGAIGCEVCGLLNRRHPGTALHCVRCGSHLHARKPDSIGRAWALMIAGVILYGPANF